MVARILLGHLEGGDYGIKVSKPNVDVLSATNTELFLSSTFNNFQFAYSGAVANPGSVGAMRTVSFPSIGVKPRVWLASDAWRIQIAANAVTETSFTFEIFGGTTSVLGPDLSGDVYWAVLAEEYEW